MSTPTESFSGSACSADPIEPEGLGEHHRGAAVQQPVGLGVALDRHRRDHPLGADLQQLDPHLLVEGTHALGHPLEELPDVHGALRSLAHAGHHRPPPGCPRRRLGSPRARDRDPSRQRRPPPAAPPRRPLAGLPRLLRAPRRELLHHHRSAHQRGLRLHLDADQRAARRAARPTSASPSTSRARPSASRSTPSTRPSATRPPTSSPASSPLIQEVLDAAAHPATSQGGLRGRRHHRHPRHPGAAPRASTC